MLSGPGLEATLCPGGVWARVESWFGTTPYGFVLGSAIGSATVLEDFGFQSPADASQGDIGISIGLPSLDAATYTSPASPQCGFGVFTYYLPIPPGVDCSGGDGMTCPAGCGHVCSSSGCDPCMPQQPSVSYGLAGSEDCLGKATAVQGSWTLALTSIAPGGSNGLTYFTPHGTLTTSLVATDGSGGTTQLSLSF
jgi:hypothetical protein